MATDAKLYKPNQIHLFVYKIFGYLLEIHFLCVKDDSFPLYFTSPPFLALYTPVYNLPLFVCLFACFSVCILLSLIVVLWTVCPCFYYYFLYLPAFLIPPFSHFKSLSTHITVFFFLFSKLNFPGKFLPKRSNLP